MFFFKDLSKFRLNSFFNQKYFYIILAVVFLILISIFINLSFSNKKILVDINDPNYIDYYYNISWYEKLNNINTQIQITQDEIKSFQKELYLLESKDNINSDDVIKIAEYNDYLWKTWKAIIVYENYFKNYDWTYFMYDNLGKLYDNICKIWNNLNKKHCKRAIQIYYYIIQRYQSLSHYKNIINVLLKMWELERAGKIYDLYLSKWWTKDAILENNLSY